MIDTDWRQNDRGLIDVLAVESNVMFAILSLIVLVAALNIISGMIMLVQDKARAIAVLRTMGARRAARSFGFSSSPARRSASSARPVASGSACWSPHNVEPIRKALSYILGVNLFPSEFYYLSELPSRIDTHDVVAVVAMALLLSIGATIYPSWRAARLDPVEALRYE